MIFDTLQFVGGLILSFGYIPQIVQIIKTKSVNDLNLKTFMSIFIGVFFMEIYAINLVVTGAGHMFLVTNKIYTYNKGDELYTPENAIIPIVKYIPKDSTVWECAEKQSEDGNITKILRENNYKVITTSIHGGYDFLKCDVPNGVDCIITNPPCGYGKKVQYYHLL